MLIEYFVDLARIDVLAATNDHVALAIDDVEESILVAITDVAGVKPTIPECCLGRLRTLEVTFENVLATQNYFAQFAIGNIAVIVIHDFHLIPNRQAA